MTTESRFERNLPDILEDLYLGPSPDYRDDVLAVAVRSRQRPAWMFPGRWLPMTDLTARVVNVPRLPMSQLIVVALLVALIAASLAVYIGSQRRVAPPFGPAGNGLIPYVSNGDIYVGDPVTGKTRLLVTNPRGAGASSPGFSPDGTKLAFFRDVPTAPSLDPLPVDILVVREDGSGLTHIAASPFNKVVWANFTPDSRQIAVIQPRDGRNHLALFDTEGKLPPVALEGAVDPDYIAFRPPYGREILFRALVGLKYGLFVMDADGTNVRTLVEPKNPVDLDQDLNAATYSADGARIYYQRWLPDSIQLWVMNADGTDQHELVSEPGPGWDGIPDPSPDGKWIAYWHVIEDGRDTQHVSVVRADGTGPIIPVGPALTGTASYGWSPDSTKILMIPDDGSSPTALLLDPAGGPWTPVPWQSDLDIDWQRIAP